MTGERDINTKAVTLIRKAQNPSTHMQCFRLYNSVSTTLFHTLSLVTTLQVRSHPLNIKVNLGADKAGVRHIIASRCSEACWHSLHQGSTWFSQSLREAGDISAEFAIVSRQIVGEKKMRRSHMMAEISAPAHHSLLAEMENCTLSNMNILQQ